MIGALNLVGFSRLYMVVTKSKFFQDANIFGHIFHLFIARLKVLKPFENVFCIYTFSAKYLKMILKRLSKKCPSNLFGVFFPAYVIVISIIQVCGKSGNWQRDLFYRHYFTGMKANLNDELFLI